MEATLEAQRESDRIYAFCLSGFGHLPVRDGDEVECRDCGTDLTNDHLINPKEF